MLGAKVLAGICKSFTANQDCGLQREEKGQLFQEVESDLQYHCCHKQT